MRVSGAQLRPRPLRGGSEMNGAEMIRLGRLGELLDGGYALIAEPQPHHALCGFDAVGLGGAMSQIGDGRRILDEFAAHGRRLPVVQDLGRGAAAEVQPLRRATQGIEIAADLVGAHRDFVSSPALAAGEAQHHHRFSRGAHQRSAQQAPQQWVDETQHRFRRMGDHDRR